MKIIEKIMAALAAIFDFINRQSDREHGRLQNEADNMKIINERENDAGKIRSYGALADDLVLAPNERGAGGMQNLPANLQPEGGGTSAAQAGSGEADKGAQRDLGEELFHKPKRAVNRVFVHCSASDNPAHDNTKVIGEWHRARGWSEIGYHYYIDKTGRLHNARSIEKIPAAQAGHNTKTIAICLGGEHTFTDAQFAALRKLCAEINLAYGGEVSFHGHREVNYGKSCPNFDYKKILGLDADGKLI